MNWCIATLITFDKYSQGVTVIFSFHPQTLLADEIACFCGRPLLLRIGFLIHRSGYWQHTIERMKHFVGTFLLFTLGQVQPGAPAQFLPILLLRPEVKIWKKKKVDGKRNARHTYEGAPADVDVDHALVAEAEEGDEEESKEYEERRKSEQD